MKLKLTSPQSRALAVALLVVALAAALSALAVPTWLLHKRYDAALEDTADRLQRYRRVAALRPQIEAATRDIEARGGRQYYLKATSPSAAAAELQGVATRIIESNRGRIISSQVVPSKDDGKSGEPVKATVSLQMNASIAQILAILHAMENNQPYLFIEQISVRAGQGRNYRPVPGVEPDFVVQLTASAFSPALGVKP